MERVHFLVQCNILCNIIYRIEQQFFCQVNVTKIEMWYSFVKVSEIIGGRNIRFHYEIHGVVIPVKVAENGLIQIDYRYTMISLDGSGGHESRCVSLNRSEIGATREL